MPRHGAQPSRDTRPSASGGQRDTAGAEARERFGIQRRPARPATAWLEVIALVLLVIPFVGWVVGVVLVWLSRLWTTRNRLIGTLGGLSWLVAGLGTSISAQGPRPVWVVGAGGTHGSQPARSHPVRAPVRPSDRRRNLPWDLAARAHRRPFRDWLATVVAVGSCRPGAVRLILRDWLCARSPGSHRSR